MLIAIPFTELNELSHKDQVRFALFCAYQVEYIWCNEPDFINAIKLAELWLENKATAEECKVACKIINDIVTNKNYLDTTIAHGFLSADAAVYAVCCSLYSIGTFYNSSKAASNAGIFAGYVNKTFLQKQRNYYNELRDIDENFQRIVLEGE